MSSEKNKILSFFSVFQSNTKKRLNLNIEKFAYLPEPNEKALKRIAQLEREINYKFKFKKIAFKALVHSSYANEHSELNIKHNERLEFLGDSVLALVLADDFFNRFPKKREGELSLMLSWLGSESHLTEVAKSINLGNYIFLGVGENNSGGRNRSSLLTDTLEAVIGSIYIDGGFLAARKVVLSLFDTGLKTVEKDKNQINCKNDLQSLLHYRKMPDPIYKIVSTSGPEHHKIFTVEVNVNDTILGSGTGLSKKEAEMNAAIDAIENIKSK